MNTFKNNKQTMNNLALQYPYGATINIETCAHISNPSTMLGTGLKVAKVVLVSVAAPVVPCNALLGLDEVDSAVGILDAAHIIGGGSGATCRYLPELCAHRIIRIVNGGTIHNEPNGKQQSPAI